MYHVRVRCPICARVSKFKSTLPPEERVCPLPDCREPHLFEEEQE